MGSEMRMSPNSIQRGSICISLRLQMRARCVNWFDQSNIDMRQTNALYLVTLQKETISPFAKENDEEKGISGDAGGSGAGGEEGLAAKRCCRGRGIRRQIKCAPTVREGLRQIRSRKY